MHSWTHTHAGGKEGEEIQNMKHDYCSSICCVKDILNIIYIYGVKSLQIYFIKIRDEVARNRQKNETRIINYEVKT